MVKRDKFKEKRKSEKNSSYVTEQLCGKYVRYHNSHSAEVVNCLGARKP